MSLINRVPKALQGLLNTQTLGENPGDLSREIRGVVDFTDLYLTDAILRLTQAIDATVGAGSAGATVSTITVPAGEIWFVRQVQAQCLIQAAQPASSKYIAVPKIQPAVDAGLSHLLATVARPSGNAGPLETNAVVYNTDKPLICVGGTIFSSFIPFAPGGNCTVTTSVLHYVVNG